MALVYGPDFARPAEVGKNIGSGSFTNVNRHLLPLSL